MRKITIVSDIHSSKFLLDSLKKHKGDMLIVAGDLTNLGKKYELEYALDIINNLKFKYKIVVFGNHDGIWNDVNFKEIYTDIIFLENEIIEIDGLKIYGTPFSKRFKNWSYYYETLDERRLLTVPLESVDIIVSHEPPSDKCLSYIPYFGCAGNPDLRRYIDNNNVKLCVCGHIHECGGNDTIINGCHCYNTAMRVKDIKIE